MNSSIQLLAWIGLLCLVPATGFCQEKEPEVEVPQGYEEAEISDEAAPARDRAGAEERGSLIDVLADALVEDVDPNVVKLEKQYLQQFQPLMKAELSFIQRVCQLTKDEHTQIGAARRRCLNAAVRKYAIAQNDVRRGRRRVVGDRSPAMPDPRKLVQEQLASLAKQKLRPEQAKRYLEELDKRAAHRKRVAIRSLVARLDEELVLTTKQREKLLKSLSTNWQDAWGQSLEMWIHNTQFMPAVPDQYMISILNKTQQEVWRGARKQGHIHMGEFGFRGGMVVVDDFDIFFEEEELFEE